MMEYIMVANKDKIMVRESDSNQINISIEEFAKAVRKGEQNDRGDSLSTVIQKWTPLIVILGAIITLTAFVIRTSDLAESNKAQIDKHEIWMDEHEKLTMDIRDSIHEVTSNQRVVIEKVNTLQKTIERAQND